jgi:pimeloyl-ACP methyl ester carboxylesterase
MKSLFKSEVGKKEIFSLYDEKLAELNIDYKYETVATSFGKTNIIVTGNPENPPLIIVHGSNGCAPIGLETYPNLSEKYQVFAVDVLGQPNKSEESLLSIKDNSHGKWLNEVITNLQLENVVLTGFSLGGLVILKTLLVDETKIKEVFLAAPVFIINGNPLKALFKVFIPMKRYMKTKNVKYVEKFLNELFTDKDEFAIKFLSKVFLHFEMDFTQVPVINKNDANTIKTPITLIAAKHDLLFPGEKMLKRASKIFPSLKKTILLDNSKHVQNRADNIKIEKLIFGNEI